jgi:5-methylcytosine-specific restriction endonuclease McrBC regulatory subunit McrC
MSELVVRERDFETIDAATFAPLAKEPEFWALLDRAILTVTHPAPDSVRLHGTRYVGRAFIGDTMINVVAKIPGSLAALLSYASGESFRLPPVETSSSSIGDLMPLLIHAFLEKARDYVSGGVDFRYAAKREVGSLVGGRLDIPHTANLRAQGMKHMVAFTRPVISRDLPKNRVTLAALRQVEELATLVSVPAADTAVARTLAQFFADVHDIDVLLGLRQRWSAEARALEAEAPTRLDKDLLALSAVLLAHESFEPGGTTLERVPRSWFVNLETLFEDAVRKVLSAVVPDGVRVNEAASFGPPIFANVSNQFRAFPDLVLRRQEAVIAIGDMKYKKWSGLATSGLHDDLYQLLVHAAAHETKVALLVYAHDEFDRIHLGMSATGADTWAFAVNVRNLRNDLARLWSVARP